MCTGHHAVLGGVQLGNVISTPRRNWIMKSELPCLSPRTASEHSRSNLDKEVPKLQSIPDNTTPVGNIESVILTVRYIFFKRLWPSGGNRGTANEASPTRLDPSRPPRSCPKGHRRGARPLDHHFHPQLLYGRGIGKLLFKRNLVIVQLLLGWGNREPFFIFSRHN